jgi:hypothetical protein
VGGLSSARSARITLQNANPAGGDIVWTVDRPESLAATTQVYLAPVKARVGNWILDVRFFADTGAGGGEVGFAQASASVTADGSLTVTISTYTGTKSVRVIPGQSVAVGETKDLAFEALNYKNEVVALSRGSVFFTIVTGSANIALANGGSAVTGLRPTQGTVSVTIDGTTSAAERVAVTSATVVTTNPTEVTIGSEFPLDLVAAIANAPEGGATFTLQTGSDNGTLTQTGDTTATYIAPKVTGDTVKTVRVTVASVYDPAVTKTVIITVVRTASIAITPNAPDLTHEEAVALTATVNGLSPSFSADDARRGVTWAVTGPAGEANTGNRYGTITPEGLYTAPRTDTNVTVEATSVYDPSVKARITVRVVSRVKVTVAPKVPDPLLISINGTQAFTKTVTGLVPGKDESVTWTVTGPAGEANTGNRYGTIGPDGVYTAPSVVPDSGLCKVVATSNYDTRAKDSANVKIVAGSVGVGIR